MSSTTPRFQDTTPRFQDTTPLLQEARSPASVVIQDHASNFCPIFLRTSHSPWACIPQNVLVGLRGLVLGYIVVTGAMTAYYKAVDESKAGGMSSVFDFSIISSVLVFLYHLITFSWTFTHLYFPDPDAVEGGTRRLIVNFMSLPEDMGSRKKQFVFSLFSSAATVFCFMNSVIYWFITRQHDAGADAVMNGSLLADTIGAAANITSTMAIPDASFYEPSGKDWFKAFVLIHLHGINSVLQVIETLFFNSIKRPSAIEIHILGLMGLSALYLGWGAVGKSVTGEFPFSWMDETQAGSKQAVSIYCTGFVLLASIMYTLLQGLVGIRESLTASRADALRADAELGSPDESLIFQQGVGAAVDAHRGYHTSSGS